MSDVISIQFWANPEEHSTLQFAAKNAGYRSYRKWIRDTALAMADGRMPPTINSRLEAAQKDLDERLAAIESREDALKLIIAELEKIPSVKELPHDPFGPIR
jgi:hypothetical protein